MNPDLLALIDAWNALTVLVIGDVMLNCYLNGVADRLCQEAPVPVVAIAQRDDLPGGAANTAANVVSLGGRVILLSVLGDDLEGDRLKRSLHQRGVPTEYLIASLERTTLAKQRVMAGSQLLVRFDQGSTEAIAPTVEQVFLAQLATLFPLCDAVIVSDYRYGVLTPRVIETLVQLQAQCPRPVVIDSKQLGAYWAVKPTAVKPNYRETTQLLGLPTLSEHRAEQLLPYGDRLLNLTGAELVATTLDVEGAITFQRGQSPYRTQAQPVPHTQAAGAGDTYTTTLTLALAAGATAQAAATLAAAATRLVVEQPGTTSCSVEQLRRSLIHPPKQLIEQSQLASLVHQYRLAGQRIVFTNGCFDILHAGHIAYLSQAKELGDVLIVGVNTDESIRSLQGEDRPINALSDRLTVLAALGCVDHVIPFAELTPHALIRNIRPDIFVKGGDYTRETLPEATLVEALGGTIKILPSPCTNKVGGNGNLLEFPPNCGNG